MFTDLNKQILPPWFRRVMTLVISHNRWTQEKDIKPLNQTQTCFKLTTEVENRVNDPLFVLENKYLQNWCFGNVSTAVTSSVHVTINCACQSGAGVYCACAAISLSAATPESLGSWPSVILHTGSKTVWPNFGSINIAADGRRYHAAFFEWQQGVWVRIISPLFWRWFHTNLTQFPLNKCCGFLHKSFRYVSWKMLPRLTC
jgi:hypothetical protein